MMQFLIKELKSRKIPHNCIETNTFMVCIKLDSITVNAPNCNFGDIGSIPILALI